MCELLRVLLSSRLGRCFIWRAVELIVYASVFVNGRKRTEIIQDMIDRIDRADRKQERLDAIKAMIDIAKDRAKKLGGNTNVL